MKIGIFADSHDHVDNVRHAVSVFNRAECELVLFAGDLVSPMVVPALRKLNCPLIACFGDNDGNKTGIEGGMKIVGSIGEPPMGVLIPDGTRILLTHVPSSTREMTDGFHVIVTAHTHRPRIFWNEQGQLQINPGETSGWTYRQPSVVLLETQPLEAEIVSLPEMPPLPVGWASAGEYSE
ncbi:MAG: metallophosphoesterase [Planctomycetaceae bacterium]